MTVYTMLCKVTKDYTSFTTEVAFRVTNKGKTAVRILGSDGKWVVLNGDQHGYTIERCAKEPICPGAPSRKRSHAVFTSRPMASLEWVDSLQVLARAAFIRQMVQQAADLNPEERRLPTVYEQLIDMPDSERQPAVDGLMRLDHTL